MGSPFLTSENRKKSMKMLTPRGYFAFQVSEIVIPKSRGENGWFQDLIFCYTSAVKRISSKWAKNTQDNNFKIERLAGDYSKTWKLLKNWSPNKSLIKNSTGELTQITSVPSTYEKQRLTVVLQQKVVAHCGLYAAKSARKQEQLKKTICSQVRKCASHGSWEAKSL